MSWSVSSALISQNTRIVSKYMESNLGFYELLMGACAILIAFGGAGAVVIKVITPAKKLLDMIRELEQRTENDFTALKAMQEDISAILDTSVVLCHAVRTHPELNNEGEVQKAYEALKGHIIKGRHKNE